MPKMTNTMSHAHSSHDLSSPSKLTSISLPPRVLSITALAWFWAGVVFGVSFVATPAKFLATSLSLPEALDVGRATFGILKYIDIGALIGLIALTLSGVRSRAELIAVFMLVVITIVQYGWLLPELDSRVALVLQGKSPPSSLSHAVYVVMELLKIGAAFVVGASALVPYTTPTQIDGRKARPSPSTDPSTDPSKVSL